MNTAIAYHPQAVAYARAGLLAIQAGHYTRSRAFLARAVELEPRLGEAWRWLAALHSGARQAICLQWAQYYSPGATLPRLPEPAWLPPLEAVPAHPATGPSVWRSAGMVASGVLLASVLALGSFELAYADRIYPGVSAFGVSLSGLAQTEAATSLTPVLAVWQQRTLTLTAADERWTVPLQALGDFTPETVVTQAFQAGRSGSWPERLHTQSSALLDSLPLAAPPLQQAQLDSLLNSIAYHVDVAPQSATFIQADNGRWAVQPSATGLHLDREQARKQLESYWRTRNWQTLPQDLAFALPLQVLEPPITTAELEVHVAQLNAQTAAPLTLTIGDQHWQVERSTLLELAAQPAAGQAFKSNSSALQAYLAILAAEIDQPALSSQLVRDGNRAREWRLAQPGRKLDTIQAAQRISRALESGSTTPLELPVSITQPPAGDLEALGIIGTVGIGKSQFASYSSSNRDANVLSGGKEFDGLLVAPGEVVSFNSTVGEITAAKGYQMGEMIAGGAVVPSYGGGICQVSTTLFRAAFWGGLPIEERHNHSWRLEWYEADAPVGMDATIALGGPDFKFRNTTAGHLLIDVETDLHTKTQTFTIYGTPLAVDVALVGPQWSGGGVVITRQIRQANAIIQEDHWISYYAQ